jgi:excisionase family DNA binding protein
MNEQTLKSATEAISLFNTDQTAQALGISRRTLQERLALGEIGCIRIGRCVRFSLEDIAEFIDRNTRHPIKQEEHGKEEL